MQGRRKKPTAVASIRVPLPRQPGGAHEDRTKRPARKAKHKKRRTDEEADER